MLSVMMNTNNFQPQSRVSPDSAVSDLARVSNNDNMNKNDENAPNESKSTVSEYDFDEYAYASDEKRVSEKKSFNYEYEIGDMVWGKVKSHPWWPGHIYDEAFATSSVRRSKRKGFILVAFFGDSSYGWFDPEELIPFEPNFAEKSKQINSKTFIKAVEEAADEASRRRGLGLACKCRKPFNFRPANVKGYFAVNLGENELASVYSTDQIKRARDDFKAKDMVAFMRNLAVMPKKDRRGTLDFLKDKAGVLAYRRAVYEEYDETYAQAFGQPTVQPSVESREAIMNTVKAPLSGPMVIAEALGKKKTPTKPGKKEQKNKDKYLFKRRDEPKESSSVQKPHIQTSTELAEGDYILQKRAPPVPPDQQTPPQQVTEDTKPSGPNGSMVKSFPSERLSDPTRGGVSLSKKSEKSKPSLDHDQKLPSVEGQNSKVKIEPGIKKAKNLKRPAGEMVSDKSLSGEKKKKRKKEMDTEMSSDRINKSVTTGKEGVSGVKLSKKAVKIDLDDDSPSPVSVGKAEIKLVDLLKDLKSLALDPFHGRERHSPAIIKKTFLKFRSLVYQKSLVLSPPSEEENQEFKSPPDNIRPSIKDRPSSKPPKPPIRVEDPTKGGRKRGPSDRQEEKAAKRLKKVAEMKSLAVEKKAQGEGKDSVIARPHKPLRAEPGKKIEAPRKIRELTFLIIKFPTQSNLPSENELKARLARFGPLDHSHSRIFWKTSTCRVVFIFKSDAEAAYRHLSGNNNLFGGVRVRCTIKPMVAPPLSDSETKAQRDDGSAVENVGEFRAQSTVQIKSCLKKSAPEVGPTRNSRVKFVLGGGESSGGGEQLVSKSILKSTSFSDGNIDSSTNTSYGVDLMNNSNNNFQQKVVPQNPLSNLQSPQVAMNVQFSQKTPTNVRNYNANMYGVVQAVASSSNKDIAQEMLTLMSRCNDVVINLKSSLGYVPYHSL